METENNDFMHNSKNIRYTVYLTEALEIGAITPQEYARSRSALVGRANLFSSLIVPIFTPIIDSIKLGIQRLTDKN
jgi:ABC-type maltose transport system permease subunit